MVVKPKVKIMKNTVYKLIFLSLFLGSRYLSGQSVEEKFYEEYTVTPEVVIDINARYTDIMIKTWDKNKVVVETTLQCQTKPQSPEEWETQIEKWDYKVMGNSRRVTITSKPKSDFLAYSLGNNVAEFYEEVLYFPEIEFESPTVSFDSMQFYYVQPPESDHLVSWGSGFMTTPFDFKKYQKEKGYLEKWKLENMDLCDKNISIRAEDTSLLCVVANLDQLLDEGDSLSCVDKLEKNVAALGEYYASTDTDGKYLSITVDPATVTAQVKKQQKEIKKSLKEMKEQQKELAKKRKEILTVLEEKQKNKIKRTIYITVPESAQFNLDVQYGTLKLPK